MADVGIAAAFIGGLASFLSPCVLPLVPAYLAYLTGISLKDAKSTRLKLFINSLFYVLGFSAVFSTLGVLLSTTLSGISYEVQSWLAKIGGIIIIFFGLYMLELIRPKFMEKEHVLKIKKLKSSYATSFVFGAAFAVGWTPCVGAVLGSVLTLAATNPASSFFLLLAYSLGLGLPFLIVGIFSSQAISLIKKIGPYLKYFNWIVGVMLILLGILVFTETLAYATDLSLVKAIITGQ